MWFPIYRFVPGVIENLFDFLKITFEVFAFRVVVKGIRVCEEKTYFGEILFDYIVMGSTLYIYYDLCKNLG